MKQKPVILTRPIPSAEDVRIKLGMSKKRARVLAVIVREWKTLAEIREMYPLSERG